MESPSKLSSGWKFLLAILLCEGVGITSGILAGAGNNMWFQTLEKPSWNPPAYLFGPVWTILYLLMGISLGLIWTNKSPEISKREPYALFAIQLFLNFWWSILFFLFHSPALALANIVLLVLFITLTIFSFSSFSRIASWFLVPYLAWVCFASYLNYTIWILNS